MHVLVLVAVDVKSLHMTVCYYYSNFKNVLNKQPSVNLNAIEFYLLKSLNE